MRPGFKSSLIHDDFSWVSLDSLSRNLTCHKYKIGWDTHSPKYIALSSSEKGWNSDVVDIEVSIWRRKHVGMA